MRRHAEEMRDLYANEIAAAIAQGHTPAQAQIESWKRYRAAALAEDPAAFLLGSPETEDT